MSAALLRCPEGSAGVTHYKCERCGFERHVRDLPRVYLLGDERRVPMEDRHVWCPTCQDICVCESLVRSPWHLQRLQKSVQRLRALMALAPAEVALLKHQRRFDRERAPMRIREIEQGELDWQEWRMRRTAPAKCLKCGTPVPQAPEERGEPIAHEGCGGMFQWWVPGAYVTRSSDLPPKGFHDIPHMYDVDGVLLQRGRKASRVMESWFEYVELELF